MGTTIKHLASPTGADNSVLDDNDVASFFKVEVRTVRLWRRTRGLPHLKLTRKVIRYKLKDIEQWADKSRTVTT
jgi:hypothetical protein